MKIALALALPIVACSFSLVAGEDMAMMAQEQRERVLAQLTAKKFPTDIATCIADLAQTDVPTRENAGKLLLAHSDRKTVIAALIAGAKDDDPDKRPNAATLLVKLGDEAVEPLIAALSVNETRPRAAWALSELRESAKPALPALTALLKNEAAARDAAMALGAIGHDAKEVLPALIEAMNNPNEEARAAIAAAIKQIGPGSEHIPLLIPLLQDKYLKVRSTIILTFGYMGDAGKPAIPAIAKHLTDPSSWCRMHAAASLARFGPDAKEAVPALRAALQDKEGVVRGNAATALARIAPSAEIVPDLIDAAQDSNERVRNLAAEALVIVGKPALEDLKGAAGATDDKVFKALLDEVIQKINSK